MAAWVVFGLLALFAALAGSVWFLGWRCGRQGHPVRPDRVLYRSRLVTMRRDVCVCGARRKITRTLNRPGASVTSVDNGQTVR